MRRSQANKGRDAHQQAGKPWSAGRRASRPGFEKKRDSHEGRAGYVRGWCGSEGSEGDGDGREAISIISKKGWNQGYEGDKVIKVLFPPQGNDRKQILIDRAGGCVVTRRRVCVAARWPSSRCGSLKGIFFSVSVFFLFFLFFSFVGRAARKRIDDRG